MVLSTVVLALCLVPGALSYRTYADQIPNGARVPVPCKDNVLWRGVGHLSVQGGGALNVFGIDFAAADHRWTSELCRKDSDGDGRTNGQELGDPQCTWAPGAIPQSTTGITHPGICEPISTDVCSQKPVPMSATVPYKIQREWLAEACESAEFVCDALNKTAGVQELALRLPQTKVPAKETTYICMMYEVHESLKSQDYHVVAMEPIINNSFVMHHMLLFGCPDNKPMYGPVECNMGGCPDLIGAWALGITGQCFHQNAGVRIGRTGYKRMMIQYHWNNPAKGGDFTDSSGLKLYYTPNLRPYDMAMFMTGQNFIQIPPRSHDVMATSDCSSTCTRNLLQGDIYVTDAANHMHYLGKKMYLQHYRDGTFLRNLTNDLEYSYDTPKFFEYPDPITLKPGDMVRTTCYFSAPDKKVTTFEGDSTSDEMCLGFLTFYPATNITGPKECVTWRSLSWCDPLTSHGCDLSNRNRFREGLSQTALYANITTACKPFGPCTDECKAAIREARSREPCLVVEDAWLLIKWDHLATMEHGRTLLASMESCELDLYKEDQHGRPSEGTPTGNNGGNTDSGRLADDQAGGSTLPRSSLLTTVAIVTLVSALLAPLL